MRVDMLGTSPDKGPFGTNENSNIHHQSMYSSTPESINTYKYNNLLSKYIL